MLTASKGAGEGRSKGCAGGLTAEGTRERLLPGCGSTLAPPFCPSKWSISSQEATDRRRMIYSSLLLPLPPSPPTRVLMVSTTNGVHVSPLSCHPPPPRPDTQQLFLSGGVREGGVLPAGGCGGERVGGRAGLHNLCSYQPDEENPKRWLCRLWDSKPGAWRGSRACLKVGSR